MKERPDLISRLLIAILVVLTALLIACLGFLFWCYLLSCSVDSSPPPVPAAAGLSDGPSESPIPSYTTSPEPSGSPESSVSPVTSASPMPSASPVPSVSPMPSVSPEPSVLPVPPEDSAAWMLRLVNPWNYMPEGYVPPLAEYAPNVQVDERCLEALQTMMRDCAAAGCSPHISSAYRTNDFQTRLYENKVAECRGLGLDKEAARKRAGQIVAIPGTSEHQLGLAVDIVDANYQLLNSAQENTNAQKWLMEHCWDYGFILRYPSDKSSITGIIYEPWHYRYVGRQAAAEIRAAGVCLEEYLAGQTVGVPSL